MYRKELNQRSPLRVFERTIHGGLGKGNIGVVMSRAGVGKSAFLVGVALDDLMRDRKVLHVNLDNRADKVREFYDEVFADLAQSTELKDRSGVHLAVERSRMILSYAGGSFSLEKLGASLEMLSAQMNFRPEVIMLDGYPRFAEATEDQLQELKKLALSLQAEMWLTALTHRDGDRRDARGVPDYVARFEEYIAVIVNLETANDHVRLAILKDHDNRNIADLHMELDPRTLLLKWR